MCVKLVKTIEGPADCEIRSVIRFLNARNVLPSEIHRRICQVYGDNAKSDGVVRKWVRMFNEGRENLYDEARSGRPALVNDDLMCKVNERVRDDRRFTISDLSLHLAQISRTLLYDLKDAVKKWLTSQAAALCEEGIQKLVPRYDKCLNNGGEFVEK